LLLEKNNEYKGSVERTSPTVQSPTSTKITLYSLLFTLF
jgi:hypothetical protein